MGSKLLGFPSIPEVAFCLVEKHWPKNQDTPTVLVLSAHLELTWTDMAHLRSESPYSGHMFLFDGETFTH